LLLLRDTASYSGDPAAAVGHRAVRPAAEAWRCSVVKQLALRLASWLTAVVLFWMLLWSPVVLGQTADDAAPDAAADRQTLGDPDAPVTIIEYASLTCPHCASYHNETFPALKERYIDTGQVHYVYRDFPLDQRALDAAVVAHCAEPEHYFGFLDVLFERQDSWARAADHVPALVTLAKLGGLPEERVRACLADEELQNAILQQRLEGETQHGVRSTPSFVIGGQTYAGNRSIEEFAGLIDPLLPGG
jgi:protein-disulfide isomerase